MATELPPEPTLGEILRNLAKHSRPGTKKNKYCPSTPIKSESEADYNEGHSSTSQGPVGPYHHNCIESKESKLLPSSILESQWAESTMYPGTRFTETEVSSLLDCLRKYSSNEEHDKLEIGLPMFQTIVKHLGFSRFFMVNNVFNVLDKDGDSKISSLELIQGLSTLLRGSFDEYVQFAFKVYDTKNEGFLTREDVTILVGESLRPTSIINWNTVPHEMIIDLAQLIFPKLDTDGDGKISLNDFRSACVNDPTLIEALGSWLPKDAPCHNAHRVSTEPVSNISNSLDYLTKTSGMAKLCVPQRPSMSRNALKAIELKLPDGRN